MFSSYKVAGKEDYEADAKLVASLKKALGEFYEIYYPLLPDESAPDFGRKKQIGNEIASTRGKIILVAHSLGASRLLKYLSETEVKIEIGGSFLIATLEMLFEIAALKRDMRKLLVPNK